jgi:hypothetical protein
MQAINKHRSSRAYSHRVRFLRICFDPLDAEGLAIEFLDEGHKLSSP